MPIPRFQTTLPRFAFVMGLAALAGAGCTQINDVGNPCVLVRKDPTDTDPSDGIRSIPIKESEIQGGKDFISFGATECEDLVCVRDANAEPNPNPDADATGFCSKPCLQTSADSCKTGRSDIDEGDQPFTCRPLLLDEGTLASIRQADPAKYEQYFGDTVSPYFCAR